MTILKPIATIQYFDITQRETNLDSYPYANRMVLVDEETNVSRTITISATNSSWIWYQKLAVTINPALKDGHTYKMTLIHTDDSLVRYRGKLFCTSQAVNTTKVNDIRDYSVNSGRYTENTETNEFILNE